MVWGFWFNNVVPNTKTIVILQYLPEVFETNLPVSFSEVHKSWLTCFLIPEKIFFKEMYQP